MSLSLHYYSGTTSMWNVHIGLARGWLAAAFAAGQDYMHTQLYSKHTSYTSTQPRLVGVYDTLASQEELSPYVDARLQRVRSQQYLLYM